MEMEMEAPGFWDNPDRSNKLMKELKNLKDTCQTYHDLEGQFEDIQTLIEMGYEENDESLIPEIQGELDSFITTLEDINEEVEKRGKFKAKIDFCGILETYKGDHYLFFKDMGVETEDNYFVKI